MPKCLFRGIAKSAAGSVRGGKQVAALLLPERAASGAQTRLDAGVNQLLPNINPDFEIIFANFLLTRSERRQRRVEAENLMKLFYVGQKWVARHSLFGTTFGEVIEVSDAGRSGVVVITDDQGHELDIFSGTAAEFQADGEWQLAD